MAVLATDLKLMKSTTAPGIGGAVTANETDGSDLFAAFTGDETSAGHTEYRCVYVKNNSAQTAFEVRVFVSAEDTHAGANYQLGLGASAIDGTETAPANDTTAPASVSFVEADGIGNALVVGDLTAGQTKALWVKLAVTAGTAAKNNFTATVSVRADTGE